MTNPTCETCRHFFPGQWYDKNECRRHAPITYPIINMGHEPHNPDCRPRFPKMNKTDWCGDHETKEAP